MKAFSVCATAALLAACGGLQPPIGASGAMPQNQGSAVTTHAERGGSWMLPEAKSEDLIYIASTQSDSVFVYSYAGILEGTLTGFSAPQGECVDKVGDVFIVNSQASNILEYAHGGSSPIVTLNDPGYAPTACSVDPSSGALAIANGTNSVSVYQNAEGKPTVYTDPNVTYTFFCSYENNGNLFITSYVEGVPHVLIELPSGSSLFQTITLKEGLNGFSPVQWDGRYLAVGYGPDGSSIYRISISGSVGTVVGTTQLNLPHQGYIENGSQWWIEARSILVPYITRGFQHARRPVGFWSYPTGRDIRRHFIVPGKRAFIGGITVSRAPSG